MKTVAAIVFAFALTAVDCFSDTTGSTGGGQSAPNRQPTMAVQYYMFNSGIFPSASDPGFGPVNHAPYAWFGEIRAYSFNTIVPTGLIPCDGRLLLISTNPALFSLLLTTYG